MSCDFPACYMGSHGCPYESECDKEIERAREQRMRDIREQEARIAYYESKVSERQADD